MSHNILPKLLLPVLAAVILVGCQGTSVKPINNENYAGAYTSIIEDPLLSLKIDGPVSVVKNWNEFNKQEQSFISYGDDARYQTRADDCIDFMTQQNVFKNWGDQKKVIHCENTIYGYGKLNDPSYPLNMIESWAKDYASGNDIINPRKGGNGTDIYTKLQSLSKAFSYYAYNYDKIDLTPERRAVIENYLVTKALKHQPEDALNLNKSCMVYANDPSRWKRDTDGDPCGSPNLKFAVSKTALGMRLGNEAVFRQGIEHTYRMARFIDEDGIFVPYATRGASSWGYYVHFAGALSRLIEIYKAAGLDLFVYKTPQGKTIKEVYDMTYSVLNEDFHLLDRYAGKIDSRSNYKLVSSLSHQEFLEQKHDLGLRDYYNPISVRENGPFQFYTLNAEYVKRFRPDIPQDRFAKFDSLDPFYYAQSLSLNVGNR